MKTTMLPTNQTILIVEDSEDILDLMEYTLSKEGYDVITCIDTSNVKNILDEEDISLILMDRNLPNVEGSVFISKLRQKGYNQPVIYVSAKDSSDEIVEGFENGGDDYITKPFDNEELVLRLMALTKRNKPNTTQCVGLLSHDELHKTISYDGMILELSKKEYELLLLLMEHVNTCVPKELILDELWMGSDSGSDGAIRVYINRIKQLLPKVTLENIRGIGYKLVS